MMALTKDDLVEISQLINVALEEIVLPEISGLKKDVKTLRKETNGYVQDLSEQIDESIILNHRYYLDCTTKKEHQSLIARVEVLEAHSR